MQLSTDTIDRKEKDKMKRVMMLVSLFVLLVLFGMVNKSENYYKKEVEVVRVNGSVVTVEDSQGRQYDFYGDEYVEEDVIVVKFDRNNSYNVNDDLIVDVIKRVE